MRRERPTGGGGGTTGPEDEATVEVTIRDLADPAAPEAEVIRLRPGDWYVTTARPLGIAGVTRYANGTVVVTLKREEPA